MIYYSLITLGIGSVIAFIVRFHNRVRRFAFFTGSVCCIALLIVWVASMRYSFLFVGSRWVAYYESGGCCLFRGANMFRQQGYKGFIHIGKSRFKTIWWMDCPAMVPLTGGWMPVVAFAIPTVLLWNRRPISKQGQCAKCGYDLTGLTEQRCPECGQPFLRQVEP